MAATFYDRAKINRETAQIYSDPSHKMQGYSPTRDQVSVDINLLLNAKSKEQIAMKPGLVWFRVPSCFKALCSGNVTGRVCPG